MRKLATIRVISEINPIKGKDRVEMATVDGWTCMVSKKDSFKKGDLCIFCEPDSVFPQTEQWDFLKKYNYRIKTQRFKDGDGVTIFSQGLVLPIEILPTNYNASVGDDVTSLLNITQYEPPMDNDTEQTVSKSNFLNRFKWYRKITKKKFSNKFPEFISKTDEERIQNIPNIITEDVVWTATEKVDGQSGTFALKRKPRRWWQFKDHYEFYVCSRNFRKPVKDSSSYWKCAEKYDIENILKSILEKRKDLEFVAFQGECIGPNIQGNKYAKKDYELKLFNIRIPGKRLGTLEAMDFAEIFGFNGKIEFVPVIYPRIEIKNLTVKDILGLSNGRSKLHKCNREGLVFRSQDGKLSFKAVSPMFLAANNE